jgi:hypothetical protein
MVGCSPKLQATHRNKSPCSKLSNWTENLRKRTLWREKGKHVLSVEEKKGKRRNRHTS